MGNLGADPVGLDGTVFRVNPATGAGLAGNPLFSSPDPNAKRIVVHGLRNPFRTTFRPGTSEPTARACEDIASRRRTPNRGEFGVPQPGLPTLAPRSAA